MKKKALALLMSDLHITRSNSAEFEKNWNEALQICKENDIKELVIGGDVFTSQASHVLSELITVKDCFVKAVSHGIHITVANGNHDLVDKNSLIGYCNVFDCINGVDVVGDFTVLTFDDVDFCLVVISYFPETNGFKEVLDKVEERVSKLRFGVENTILYVHEGIHGGLGDFDIPGECPQEWFEGYMAVWAGHYHEPKKLKGTNIEYLGASKQSNFGESEKKGYTILYSDGTKKFIQNEVNTRYRTIEADYEDDLQLDDDPRYKTRLKLNCTDAQAKTIDKDKLLAMGFNKIELKTEKVKVTESKATDLDQRFDKQGIKKEYKKFCNTKEIEPDLGLKYLDKLN